MDITCFLYAMHHKRDGMVWEKHGDQGLVLPLTNCDPGQVKEAPPNPNPASISIIENIKA